MTARASVPLEDDVAALVDSDAVILVHDHADVRKPKKMNIGDRVGKGKTHLSSMMRLSELTSKPSVLCPAALPPLLELGWSPAATRRNAVMNFSNRK